MYDMLLHAVLIGAIAGLAKLDSRTFGDNMLGRPIIVCPLIGLVLGDFTTGLTVGGTLELIYLGVVGMGSSMAADVIAGSTVAAALAIKADWAHGVAVSAAIPVSALAIKLTNYTKVLNAYWFGKAEKFAGSCQLNKIEWAHRGGYLIYFLTAFFPSFVIYGTVDYFSGALSGLLPSWLSEGLTLGAGLLTAVGFAMLISMIFTKRLAPFYFGGFVLAAFFGLNVIGVAVVALLVALILNQLRDKNHDEGAGVHG
ncbi:PTS mannose/fructose/sorbose/N-acetylgalactosamine transporter subunit IIC [Paenibacillus hamazuiensis]|uniref:PTS mannose/fructose/sorbose/N-acetylgalactosamine transporter subunit IIC n=1 Tax=Paenibacillus hamazuiensis TaxID=2936508 RepID=UPI00200D9C65|nr:PTS sugar transporter subunit IIC [Paenibacillus hamazuiensis]